MQIFVPSAGRVEICAKYTGRMLQESPSSKDTYLVVPSSQAVEYHKALPKLGILPISDELENNGIGAKRQYILEKLATEKYCFQLDDDIKFYVRTDKNKAVPAEPHNLTEMFWLFEEWLGEDEVALVGSGSRYMFQERELSYENNPCVQIMGIDKKVFMDNNIRFDEYEILEDYYVAMMVFLSGYSSRLTYLYLHDSLPANYKGGVSRYRTAEMQTAYTKKFQKQFSEFVKFRKDVVVPNMGTVPGMTIQWKKAYQAGQFRRKGNNLWKE